MRLWRERILRRCGRILRRRGRIHCLGEKEAQIGQVFHLDSPRRELLLRRSRRDELREQPNADSVVRALATYIPHATKTIARSGPDTTPSLLRSAIALPLPQFDLANP